MRRFTRLTNAFSKNVENHAAAVALYFMYYNFGRVHQTARDASNGNGDRKSRVLGRGDCGTLGQKGLMNSRHVGAGVSLGLCFGAALGTALHTLGWSSSAISVGIALGVSLGTVASSRFVFGGRSDAALARKKVVSEKPLPHPLGL